MDPDPGNGIVPFAWYGPIFEVHANPSRLDTWSTQVRIDPDVPLWVRDALVRQRAGQGLSAVRLTRTRRILADHLSEFLSYGIYHRRTITNVLFRIRNTQLV